MRILSAWWNNGGIAFIQISEYEKGAYYEKEDHGTYACDGCGRAFDGACRLFADDGQVEYKVRHHRRAVGG